LICLGCSQIFELLHPFKGIVYNIVYKNDLSPRTNSLSEAITLPVVPPQQLNWFLGSPVCILDHIQNELWPCMFQCVTVIVCHLQGLAVEKSSDLTFRHRASPILGQAFRYSPENAFYIFNQQIYFIIWYLLTVHHWYK
jgi:hypothetical protein